MSVKERRTSNDLVIDLTDQPYFATEPPATTRVLRTLPDRLEHTPVPADRERYGDLGLAATLPIRRRPRLRRWFRDFDPMTILAITAVLTVGVLMAAAVATFR